MLMFTVLVMREVVVSVIVFFFLEYCLLFCIDIEVVSVQAKGSGAGHSSTPPSLVTHTRKCTWEQVLGGHAMGWVPSPNPFTTLGEDGFQWCNLKKRSDITPETDS